MDKNEKKNEERKIVSARFGVWLCFVKKEKVELFR